MSNTKLKEKETCFFVEQLRNSYIQPHASTTIFGSVIRVAVELVSKNNISSDENCVAVQHGTSSKLFSLFCDDWFCNILYVFSMKNGRISREEQKAQPSICQREKICAEKGKKKWKKQILKQKCYILVYLILWVSICEWVLRIENVCIGWIYNDEFMAFQATGLAHADIFQKRVRLHEFMRRIHWINQPKWKQSKDERTECVVWPRFTHCYFQEGQT